MNEKLWEILFEHAGDAKFVVIAAFLLPVIAQAIRLAWTLFDNIGSRQQRFIERSLKLEYLGAVERLTLIEEINFEVFRKATGIPARPAMRLALIAAVQASGGEISIRSFAKARQFLVLKDGSVAIQISTWSRIGQAINWVYSLLFVLLSLTALTGAFSLTQATPVQKSGLFAAGFFFLALAVFFLFQTVPMSIAKRIAKEIETLEHTAATPIESEPCGG